MLDSSDFAARVDSAFDKFETYMSGTSVHSSFPSTAYFCMEFGLHESLPLYSGGLGILAGDHLKAASDVGLPLTAVGIFLRDGYFKQFFDSRNRQQDEYPSIDVTLHPLELVEDEDGNPIIVTVHLGSMPLDLRAWKLQVGRVELYLLDADFDHNAYEYRTLTRRLYQSSQKTRIRQEIILGIGGIRLLRAMDKSIDVYHLNEGHCAFLTLELLREEQNSGGEEGVRSKCVFTTHTPVMSGHDRFEPKLVTSELILIQKRLGISDKKLLSYGRVNPSDSAEKFTMTVLGLKMSRSANGVSRLNGEVARRQWHHLYADRAVEDVPIKHVTNGIHLPTWASPAAREFLSVYLGDWESNRHQKSVWSRVGLIPDDELWRYRCDLRERLVDFIRDRTRRQSFVQEVDIDPDALTIGFARRFAAYKRAPLFFFDLDRAAKLLSNPDRPVQIIYAGKAHPADTEGQALIRRILEITHMEAFRGKVIYLEDYNMQIGRMLVSGCDVWLNNPRRPYEASGTSGQKVAIHGGLNLSILDGWWPEGFNGHNGWAIGDDASHEYKDPSVQDPEDALYLYEKLEREVVPMFFDRNERGIPERWLAFVREAMGELCYAFSAHRMIVDYIEQIYSTKDE